MDDERRYKMLSVGEDALALILLGFHRIVPGQCPLDLRFAGAHYDYQTGTFRVRLQSSTFDPVPPGRMIPEVVWTFQSNDEWRPKQNNEGAEEGE